MGRPLGSKNKVREEGDVVVLERTENTQVLKVGDTVVVSGDPAYGYEPEPTPPNFERYRLQLDPKFDNWLIERLEARKPYYQRAGWLSQLLQISGMNDWIVIKLNNSIFMGAVHKDPLDPRVRIQEFICWTMDEKWYDCMKLYREVRRRALAMNCVCLNLGRDTCVPQNEIERQLKGQYPADMFVDLT